ncbi:MAG: hypothetical protein ABR981_00695 [Candidatus Micrarchaeaceae archaeon]|jgi:hypothetical protein
MNTKKDSFSIKRNKKGSIPGAFLAILIVIIIAAAIFFVADINHSTQTYAPQLPSFPNVSSSIPAAFPNVLSEPSSQSTLQLKQLSQSSLSNISQFTILYNGSIQVRPSGFTSSIASVDSPIYMNESKYHSNLKLYIKATSLPVIGTGEIFFLNQTNGTFICTNFNASAASNGKYSNLILGSRSISCINSDNLIGINFNQLAYFNLNELANFGINVAYQKSYQSKYNGIPCTFVSGNLTELGSNSSIIGKGAFEMCYSDTYYMPLSFSAYMNGNNGAFAMNLNASSISNSSSQSYVESLPGPVISK